MRARLFHGILLLLPDVPAPSTFNDFLSCFRKHRAHIVAVVLLMSCLTSCLAFDIFLCAALFARILHYFLLCSAAWFSFALCCVFWTLSCILLVSANFVYCYSILCLRLPVCALSYIVSAWLFYFFLPICLAVLCLLSCVRLCLSVPTSAALLRKTSPWLSLSGRDKGLSTTRIHICVKLSGVWFGFDRCLFGLENYCPNERQNSLSRHYVRCIFQI